LHRTYGTALRRRSRCRARRAPGTRGSGPSRGRPV
jgi:hypothetical protein